MASKQRDMAGYSRKELVDKLGIKAGMHVLLLGQPADYTRTLGPIPLGVTVVDALAPGLTFIQMFTRSRAELAAALPKLKAALAVDGQLWISWPKGAARVATDLSENIVRELALAIGLVDVKVCAVDKVWSGLKIVIPRRDRH
jgi:hypothetical protein